MKTITSLRRWFAGGLSVVLMTAGCATGPSGKMFVRNQDGTFDAGGTTYWDMDPSAGSEDINADNYYYRRVTVIGNTTYEEFGYYLTHPPGHASGPVGTRIWQKPLAPKGSVHRSGADADTETGWYTNITHPGGNPEVESTECGAVIRITHPGG